MKKLLITALFLGWAGRSDARIYSMKKRGDAGQMHSALKDASYRVNWVTCDGEQCRVELDDRETKNPVSAIAAFVPKDQKKEEEALRALALKWREGTISTEEKDELLKALVMRLLGL